MKKINIDHLDIHVDTKESRLFFPIKDSQDAELKYRLHTERKPTVIEFTETYVPETLRQQGLGSKLAERGMRLAEANKYNVKATCSFVEDYLSKHPEFQSLQFMSSI